LTNFLPRWEQAHSLEFNDSQWIQEKGEIEGIYRATNSHTHTTFQGIANPIIGNGNVGPKQILNPRVKIELDH